MASTSLEMRSEAVASREGEGAGDLYTERAGSCTGSQFAELAAASRVGAASAGVVSVVRSEGGVLGEALASVAPSETGAEGVLGSDTTVVLRGVVSMA